MRWFKSREELERENVIKVQAQVNSTVGRCFADTIGTEPFISLWFALGTILLAATEEPSVTILISDGSRMAAAEVCVFAGLMHRGEITSPARSYEITDKGRETVKRVFRRQFSC